MNQANERAKTGPQRGWWLNDSVDGNKKNLFRPVIHTLCTCLQHFFHSLVPLTHCGFGGRDRLAGLSVDGPSLSVLAHRL